MGQEQEKMMDKDVKDVFTMIETEMLELCLSNLSGDLVKIHHFLEKIDDSDKNVNDVIIQTFNKPLINLILLYNKIHEKSSFARPVPKKREGDDTLPSLPTFENGDKNG